MFPLNTALRGGTETNRQCFADIGKSLQSQYDKDVCRIDALKHKHSITKTLRQQT